MITKTIKFKDFDGEPAEETHYFHLNKFELIQLQVSEKGGLDAYLRNLIAAEDAKAAYAWIAELILMSHGVKQSNGQFKKSAKTRRRFQQSEAFSELAVALLSSTKEAQAFIEGLAPEKVVRELAEQLGSRDDDSKKDKKKAKDRPKDEIVEDMRRLNPTE